MIPIFPKFKSLSAEDIPALTEYLGKLPRHICELSLANIYLWQDFDRPQLTRINNDLCVMINPPNEEPYWLEPFGRSKLVETTDTCLRHAARISRVSKNYVDLLPKAKYKITPLRNQFDYLYETRALAELKGKKYDGKRNHLKRFQHKYPGYQFIPLTLTHKNACLELFEKWFKVREESRFYPKLAHIAQRNALLVAFRLYDELNLTGGALMVGDDVKGFTIGSRLNHETASVHFAYGDPELPGIAQTLLWEGCNRTFSRFKYVNLEQDLGIPGLRTAKLSWQPLKLEEKFELKLL